MMLLGLLEKELRQNLLTLGVIVAVCLAASAAVLTGQPLVFLKGSGLDLVSYVMLVFLPLGCYVLAGSMIGGEFRHKTQIFLEGLPLPRWQMLLVKLLLGLAASLGLSWLLIASAWWQGRESESMTRGFVALLLAKSGAWAAFVWTVNFTLAFLGRYRLPFALTVVLGLMILNAEGFDVAAHGPLTLLDATFAYERHVWPIRDLVITFTSSWAIAAVGYLLGSVRHASLATLLAQKMSNRERIMLSLLALTAIAGIGLSHQARQETQPVHLPGSVDWSQDGVRVQVAAAVENPTPEEWAALQRWSEQIGRFFHETAAWLRRPELPPIYLVHRRDYVTARLDWQSLDSRQGVLVRLNVLNNDPADVQLREELLSKVLHAALHYRLKFKGDASGWVLDGFAHRWPRTQIQPPAPAMVNPALTPQQLAGWLKVRQDLGEKQARQVAAVALDCLAKVGESHQRDFVAAILGRQVPHHSGALLLEWLHPPDALLRQHTGLDWPQLAEQWSQALSVKPQPGGASNGP